MVQTLTVEMRLQKECLEQRNLEGGWKSVRSEQNQVGSPFQIDYTQQFIQSCIKLSITDLFIQETS